MISTEKRAITRKEPSVLSPVERKLINENEPEQIQDNAITFVVFDDDLMLLLITLMRILCLLRRKVIYR